MTEKKLSAALVSGELAGLRSFIEGEVCAVVREAVKRRGDIIAAEIARRMLSCQGSQDRNQAPSGDAEWIKVYSLTTIRSVVGGRFELLKQRWTNAGLPLKAHRGARPPPLSRDPSGWRDFVLWLLKQGYEMKEVDEPAEHLFEIRKLIAEK